MSSDCEVEDVYFSQDERREYIAQLSNIIEGVKYNDLTMLEFLREFDLRLNEVRHAIPSAAWEVLHRLNCSISKIFERQTDIGKVIALEVRNAAVISDLLDLMVYVINHGGQIELEMASSDK